MDEPRPPYTPEPVSTDAERPPALDEIKQHIIASEYHTDEALRLISLWEKSFDEAIALAASVPEPWPWNEPKLSDEELLAVSLDAASDEALFHFEEQLEHNSSDGPSAGDGNA